MAMTTMMKMNKAKMFTLLGALVLLGAAAGATAGSAVDKEVSASLSGDGEQVTASVDEATQIDNELAAAAHAELFAGAELDVQLQHELVESLELAIALEEEAETLTELSTKLTAEKQAELEAKAEALLQQSTELRMLVEAQLEALNVGSAELLAALETENAAMIEGALENEIELVAAIEAEIEVAGTMTDEILMEAEALQAALEAESMAHVGTAGVAELGSAAQSVSEAAAEVQAQVEITLGSHVDAVQDLVGALGLYVDLDVWLDVNGDIPLVGTATADISGTISGGVGGLLGAEDEDDNESGDSEGSSDGDSEDSEGSSEGDSEDSEGSSEGDSEDSEGSAEEEDNGSQGSHEDEDGSIESEDSGSTDHTTEACAGPDRLNVDHGSQEDTIIVQWKAMAEAEGYNVYRSEAGGEYELIASQDAGENSLLDADIEHKVSYEYRVTAIVDGEETEHCTSVEITSVPVFTTILAAVGAAGAGLGGYAFMRRRQ